MQHEKRTVMPRDHLQRHIVRLAKEGQPRGALNFALIASLCLWTLTLWAAPPALAQDVPLTPISPPVQETFGLWNRICEDEVGAPEPLCRLEQKILAIDRPGIEITIVFFTTSDGQTDLMKIIAPLNVLLSRGLALTIDQDRIGEAPFTRCFETGCHADIIVDGALVLLLSEATSLLVTLHMTPENAIGLPVSLDGLASGLEALGIDGKTG